MNVQVKSSKELHLIDYLKFYSFKFFNPLKRNINSCPHCGNQKYYSFLKLRSSRFKSFVLNLIFS